MENKKVLVTGASGFVGQALTEELCRHNEVWGLARFRNPQVKERLASLGVKLITKDAAREKLDDVPRDFDYVFNELALLGGELQEHPQPAYEVNAYFVGRLMEHCRQAQGIILASTGAVYSLSPLPSREGPALTASEDSPVGYNMGMGLYSSSKFAGEVVATYVSRQLDIPTCILRYFWPYSSQGGLIYFLARAVAEGREVAVNRRQPTWYSTHYISDCVRYTIEAAELCSVPAKPINVTGTAATHEEFLTRIGEKLGKAPKIVETDQAGPSGIADISLLIELLGEPEVSLDEGINRVVDAIRKSV